MSDVEAVIQRLRSRRRAEQLRAALELERLV